jgi:tetratricopeptide (TPR) repeat protein
MERLRKLAEQALALHAAKPAGGEDVYRLAEICLEAERFDEAVTFATRYLDAAGKEPPPNLGFAHAVRVRALARLGRLPEAESAMKAYQEALPKADGLSPVSKLLGDALVTGGRLEEGLVRYRAAAGLLPRPLPSTGAGTFQALAEALVALGRPEEARKAVEAALKDAADPPTQERLRAILYRIALVGKPFAPLPFDRWLQGSAPESGASRGKVVVWHVFAWWMDARASFLDDWGKRLAESGEKGLLVLPVTRTGGWDPAAKKFEEKRPADVEAADVGKHLKGRGWTGPCALYLGEEGFKALEVRGLPLEIVVGRDGLVRIATAGSDAGHALALRVAAAALLESPPAPR